MEKQVEPLGRRLAGGGIWAILAVASLWLSLFAAWQSLSAVDFAYRAIYDLADIADTINQYGPQNRYKRGFATTDRAEHLRLFGEIVRAINHDGEGLADIRYHDPEGRPIDRLMRQPEVQHLQDVARLLATLRAATWVCGFVFVIALFVAYRRGLQPPRALRVLAAVSAACAIVALGIVAYGPVDLFYRWHTLVFPEGHQWFFYYQDSLMTTLMRAPVIFGYIAVVLAVVALAFFAVIWWSLGKLCAARAAVGRTP
jgi:hypothetical protein